MTRSKQIALGLGLFAVLAVGAGGALTVWLGRERPAYNLGSDGLALSGWDPVSYHAGEPVPGDARLGFVHEGRRYLFADAKNRERFAAAPRRYEPAYGGWCAYAVANGYKFEVNPASYLIEDGRLLLFYRGVFGDARQAFDDGGRDDGIRRADANWPGLRDG